MKSKKSQMCTYPPACNLPHKTNDVFCGFHRSLYDQQVLKMRDHVDHTPTPYCVAHDASNNACIVDANGDTIAFDLSEANAAFIVRAVNSHEDLLKMLKCWIVRYGNTTENKWLAKNSRAAISKAEEGL